MQCVRTGLRFSAPVLFACCGFQAAFAQREPTSKIPTIVHTAEIPAGDATAEIVVTATRREERLSRVPASVTALSRAALDARGVKTFADVVRFTPGVRFDPETSSISIRGIAAGGGGAGTTGIYIDDSPIQMRGLGFNPDETLPAIFDLERVEVLRGPQGTLFGAGSEGGTVRYITPQPSLTAQSVYARAELAATAHGGLSWEVGSAAGTPLKTDALGLRISAWHRYDAGYIDHVENTTGRLDDRNINHSDVTAVRAALAWRPAGDVLVTPSVLYQRRASAAWNSFFAGLSDPGSGIYRTSSPEYRGSADRYVLPSLNVKYEVSSVSIVANASYFHRRNVTGYDGTVYDLSYYQHADIYQGPYSNNPLYPFLLSTGINPNLPPYFSPSRVLNGQSILTGELRAQSASAGRLEWVTGLFYQHSHSSSAEALVEENVGDFYEQVFGESEEELFGYPNFGKMNYYKKTNSVESQIAVFGNLRYELLPGLKLSAGGRLARTRFAFDGVEAGNFTELPVASAGRTKQVPITPKIGIDYQLDPHNLIYVSWAKGFRGGGANPPVNASACQTDLQLLGVDRTPETYKSDSVGTLEFGTKSTLAGGAVRLAGSAYRSRWSSIQQNVYLASCGLQFVANLGKARIQGFDLQATVTPAPAVVLDAAFGYTHARLSETISVGPGTTSARAGDAIEGPPWTAALGARYDLRLGSRSFYVRADVQYFSRLRHVTSERNPLNETSYLPGEKAPSAVTNASLRAGTFLKGLDVSIFVDNLLDTAPLYRSAPVDAQAELVTASAARPRVIGMTIVVRQ